MAKTNLHKKKVYLNMAGLFVPGGLLEYFRNVLSTRIFTYSTTLFTENGLTRIQSLVNFS